MLETGLSIVHFDDIGEKRKKKKQESEIPEIYLLSDRFSCLHVCEMLNTFIAAPI